MTSSSPPPATEAAVWRRYDDDEQRLTAGVSERMLDLAGLRPGLRVLDIATGRGEPALRAAARVAPGGHVLGTDRSDEMMAFARERAAALQLANFTTKVADAQTLGDIPHGVFDVALCRWGLMYLPQPRLALAAVKERLVRGGLFVAAVWTAPAQVSYWSMPRDVLARHAIVPPVDTEVAGTFQYAPADKLRDDLQCAGFSVVHEEDIATAVMESATPDGLVAWCLAFGLERLLAGQPASVRAAWERDMVAEAGRHRHADGMFRLGGTTRLAVARA